MNEFEGQLAKQGYESASVDMVRMPNLKERLELAVRKAEEKLAAAKEAREIFNRNPDLERLLDLMQKGNF